VTSFRRPHYGREIPGDRSPADCAGGPRKHVHRAGAPRPRLPDHRRPPQRRRHRYAGVPDRRDADWPANIPEEFDTSGEGRMSELIEGVFSTKRGKIIAEGLFLESEES